MYIVQTVVEDTSMNTQVSQFMSIAKQWGHRKDDANLFRDPYYCWVEVPAQKQKTKQLTK